jgi:single-strand DNA-binding protein
MTEQQLQDPSAQNAVVLRGRISSAPIKRELPSGDVILTFRVVVGRDKTPMTAKSRQTSDWVDCTAWGGRVKRRITKWQLGDVVEIEGALRRRFFRSESRTSTRVEVEVLGGRLLEKAA